MDNLESLMGCQMVPLLSRWCFCEHGCDTVLGLIWTCLLLARSLMFSWETLLYTVVFLLKVRSVLFSLLVLWAMWVWCLEYHLECILHSPFICDMLLSCITVFGASCCIEAQTSSLGRLLWALDSLEAEHGQLAALQWFRVASSGLQQPPALPQWGRWLARMKAAGLILDPKATARHDSLRLRSTNPCSPYSLISQPLFSFLVTSYSSLLPHLNLRFSSF